MYINSCELQKAIAEWRLSKVASDGWMFPSDAVICAKAAEELGEFIRAVIGVLENRPDRGDPLQEAAQTILVLMYYFGLKYENPNVLEVLINECERLGINTKAVLDLE